MPEATTSVNGQITDAITQTNVPGEAPAAHKVDLSESRSIGTLLHVDPHSIATPSLEGRWRWEIVCENSSHLFVKVEGHIADGKTISLAANLTRADAKRLNVWLTTLIPSIEQGLG